MFIKRTLPFLRNFTEIFFFFKNNTLGPLHAESKMWKMPCLHRNNIVVW